jgi:hypothetical protein
VQNLPSYNPQQRQLLRLILLKMMQEQAAKGSTQPSKPSSLEELLRTAKKAKDTYDDGKKIYNAGAGIYESLTAPAYSEATQAAWNQAAGEASQQAWNAGAEAASGTGSAATPSTSASTPNYGGYAAAALSAYNSANRFKNASRDEQQAYEASMATPRAVAAFYTLGGSELAEGIARKQWGGTMKKFDKFMMNNPMSPVFVPMQASKLWTSDKWKTEGNRLKKLIDQGVEVPESYQAPMMLKRGRKKEELINPYVPKDFVGNTPQYGWVNNKFADSRKEDDLKAEDIWGYANFFERYGNDWTKKFSEQQRRDIAQKALASGAVNEHHGTIDVDWSKVKDVPEAVAIQPKPATPTANQPIQIVNKPQPFKIPRK